MTGAAPFMRICRLNPTAFTSLQSAALPASHKQRRFQVTTNQGIDVSTVRMQEIAPDDELTALRAQVEALRKVYEAAHELMCQAEEYDFDDGLGKGAAQEHWDTLDECSASYRWGLR